MTTADILFDRREAQSPDASAPPLVCVAVSVFNYADDVTNALDSVAAQTHRRLELVVVDDASSDGSAEVVRKWLYTRSARFERGLLLRHERNKGLSVARNTAFAAAEAEAVMVLDADNLLQPTAVARLREALQDADADCAYSQLWHFGIGEGVGVADVWRPEGFLHDNYIDAMALVSRSAWATVGGYHDMGGWEDYDFWCKFVEAGLKGVYVPELLCRYQVHLNSMVRTETKRKRHRLVHQMMARHPWLDLQV